MIKEEFEKRCQMTTDINKHLPLLKDLAMKVNHVTEFGVREGHSTIAFARGYPDSLISYDIKSISKELRTLLEETNFFEFIQADTLDVEIELTDLLFIDSYHTYKQLNRELELHSGKVGRFLVFHDTETFGNIGEDGSRPGLQQAIDEFLDNSELEVYADFKNNNGLTVLSR